MDINTNPTTADEAVANGVLVLDELFPEGWRNRIDIGNLDLSVPSHCILGQLFEPDEDAPWWATDSWNKGTHAVHDVLDEVAGIDADDTDLGAAVIAGFDIIGGSGSYDYADLQEAWLEVLPFPSE